MTRSVVVPGSRVRYASWNVVATYVLIHTVEPGVSYLVHKGLPGAHLHGHLALALRLDDSHVVHVQDEHGLLVYKSGHGQLIHTLGRSQLEEGAEDGVHGGGLGKQAQVVLAVENGADS